MTTGNHGVGVAYAAQQGGYKAVIFVPRCMKQERRDRITGLGKTQQVLRKDVCTLHLHKVIITIKTCSFAKLLSQLTRAGARLEEVAGDYDAAIAAVRAAAEHNKWTLVADTAWEGCVTMTTRVTMTTLLLP